MLPKISFLEKGEKQAQPNQLSQSERARGVIEQAKISFDPKLHTFTVMGSSHPHAVTLFPKETCSCPSTTHCYHILAAKMSIGQTADAQVKVLNLTQLRRNARSRTDKKSGRKRPHPGDYDVQPASDANTSQTTGMLT